MTAANYEAFDTASRSDSLPAGRSVKDYGRRYRRLQRLREKYLPIWRVLNEFQHPWSGKYLFGEKDRAQIMLAHKITNGVVLDAARTCASGLHGGLTSPAKPWFDLTHIDSEMMELPQVKAWMHKAQEIMRGVLQQSNFYEVMPNLYYEAIIYGTAAAIIDRDDKTGVRLRHLTIGEYSLALGADLRVSTLYRRMEMTAGQLVERYGRDNKGYTEAVRTAIRDHNLDEITFTIIHAMQPIGTFDNKTAGDFAYESVYFMEEKESEDARIVLEVQKHRTCPFIAVRWATTADDIYGYSPGMMALPNDRMLQTMDKDYIEAVEKVVKPTLIAPSEIKDAFDRGRGRPGDIIPYNAQGNAQIVQSLYQVQFDFNNVRQKISEVVQQIQSVFFNHLFLSILFNTKAMTATEVAQRLEEKAMVLGPVLERFQSELFDPMLDRVFAIMFYEYQVIPTPPEEIRQGNLKINYVGALAQSVKMVGLSNITNTLPIITELLKLDSSAVIKLNVKELIDYITVAAIWPPNGTRTDEECQQIEELQRQAQELQAQMEQMSAMATAAKTASETSLANGSALTGAEGGVDMGGMN